MLLAATCGGQRQGSPGGPLTGYRGSRHATGHLRDRKAAFRRRAKADATSKVEDLPRHPPSLVARGGDRCAPGRASQRGAGGVRSSPRPRARRRRAGPSRERRVGGRGLRRSCRPALLRHRGRLETSSGVETARGATSERGHLDGHGSPWRSAAPRRADAASPPPTEGLTPTPGNPISAPPGRPPRALNRWFARAKRRRRSRDGRPPTT